MMYDTGTPTQAALALKAPRLRSGCGLTAGKDGKLGVKASFVAVDGAPELDTLVAFVDTAIILADPNQPRLPLRDHAARKKAKETSQALARTICISPYDLQTVFQALSDKNTL